MNQCQENICEKRLWNGITGKLNYETIGSDEWEAQFFRFYYIYNNEHLIQHLMHGKKSGSYCELRTDDLFLHMDLRCYCKR